MNGLDTTRTANAGSYINERQQGSYTSHTPSYRQKILGWLRRE